MLPITFLLLLLSVHLSTQQLGDVVIQQRTLVPGQFRIVEGRDADIAEFPYQVSIEYYRQHWCGGAIIGPNIILTAAHCIEPIKDLVNVSPQLMRIRVGSNLSGFGGKLLEIERAIQHEGYIKDAKSDDNDIGIIFLKESIKYSENIQPVMLPTEQPVSGMMVYVTGYGHQKQMRRSLGAGRHLAAIKIPIIDRDKCQAIHDRFGNIIAENMICAGASTGHKDSCKGDSGGPMVANNRLVGLVAWGIGCGREGIPGVYINVYNYIPWIERKLEDYAV